jgi:hypothetical protein
VVGGLLHSRNLCRRYSGLPQICAKKDGERLTQLAIDPDTFRCVVIRKYEHALEEHLIEHPPHLLRGLPVGRCTIRGQLQRPVEVPLDGVEAVDLSHLIRTAAQFAFERALEGDDAATIDQGDLESALSATKPSVMVEDMVIFNEEIARYART